MRKLCVVEKSGIPGPSHLIQLVTVSCLGALIDRDRLGESKAQLL